MTRTISGRAAVTGAVAAATLALMLALVAPAFASHDGHVYEELADGYGHSAGEAIWQDYENGADQDDFFVCDRDSNDKWALAVRVKINGVWKLEVDGNDSGCEQLGNDSSDGVPNLKEGGYWYFEVCKWNGQLYESSCTGWNVYE